MCFVYQIKRWADDESLAHEQHTLHIAHVRWVYQGSMCEAALALGALFG